ncbi:17-beta-hydroxysteroid dehydrogenase type 1 isoform 2 [Homo sapiens]|uniref:Estradiol 17-beta-dehydrogenase n=1 Tax=Homo sapiens TaxID=9606 RepID=A0A0A0MQS7_HUMAN|nr:17-beta-hydroxysteroid dehydrogenase type 1 isoform 2 [Homo sapiens]KAI2583101.1 hydroxysteroid 17-beta dehydrogenase 1 [Homo sapiens]|eukprot:NP_001317148.1 estradiol 17-beta-dehydrogenase 1 isoform 2 [Homo sapiens]
MARTVVLITGCSSGIGLHLAVRLASDPSQSFKVYATLRDLKTQGRLWEAARALACPPGSLETLQLDVRDSKSVAAARERVTEGRVDVLVCNAGLGLLGPLEALGEDAVASVLDVNVVGTVRMLQAFLPDMKRRGSGRVLVTGSVGGLMGLPFNDVYCASKFALEGLCESLAVLLLPFGVHSLSLIECGPVHTAFMEKVLGSPEEVLDRTDIHTFHRFYQYLAHSKQVFREAAQNPEEVAEVFLTALRAPKPTLRYFTTERFLPLLRMRLDDPSGSNYVTAMHREVFGDVPAKAEAGAEAGGGAGPGAEDEAGRGAVGDPELGDPPAAPQ